MKSLFIYGLIVSTACSLFSCTHTSTSIDSILKEVERIAEPYPDSALILLDSIQSPYELSTDQFAHYILYTVQAKLKTDKDITSDTLIFRTKEYYRKKNQQKKMVMAQFYSGQVLLSQEKQEKAMQAFLETRDTADKINDVYWSAMADFYIGYLNYTQFLCEEARVHFKSANRKFSTIKGQYKKEITTCYYISNSFLLAQPQVVDSAMFYERKSLEIAKQYNDLTEQINASQRIGGAWLESDNTSLAKEAILHAMALSTETNNYSGLPEIYESLARIYQQDHKPDSALYFAELALKSTDDYGLKAIVYKTMSDIETSRGNFRKSLEYLHIYSDYADSIYDRKQEYNIMDVQKKYNFERIQNANRKLMIEKLWVTIALIITVLCVVAIVFYIYRKRAIDKEALLLAKQQIYQLKEMITTKENEENDINKKLRNALYEQLDIIKKVSLLEGYLGNEVKISGKEVLQKVNRIIYKSNATFDWSSIFQLVNALHDDFLTRLEKAYPTLTESEILVCCLLKIGFNNEEIRLLLRANYNIAQKKKTSIREKTGMKKQEHFIKQLDERLKMNDLT